MDYATYLQSPTWLARRASFYSRIDKVCRACGSRRRVDLHHLTYERLGAERDGDLMPLCHRCHLAVHRSYKRRRPRVSLAQATNDYVARRRR